MGARGGGRRLGADDVVVVSGGGVAGLALAAALARERERRGGDGATCVVLERDESAAARRQGYGVTLSETNAALAGLGVAERCRERNCKSSAHWTFGASGRVLGYYGMTFVSSVSTVGGEARGGIGWEEETADEFTRAEKRSAGNFIRTDPGGLDQVGGQASRLRRG